MKIEDLESDLDRMSFITGTVRQKDLAYLIAVSDKLAAARTPHSRVIQIYRGDVGTIDVNWAIQSVTIGKRPDERMIGISEQGFVFVMGGGKYGEEPGIIDASDQRLAPARRGPMREVRGIAGGHAVAVGTARQAYRREAPGVWKCFDQTAQEPNVDLTEKSFESVDGFSESDLYAVGWDGEIWHFDGRRWTQKDSPTNLALYRVRCAEDGNVYACGQSGVLLRGRDDRWEIIGEGHTSEDLWGLEFFAGKLYAASLRLLYVFDGAALADADWGDEPPPTSCHQLSAADGILWSIGAKDVMAFDGQAWSSVI
ncbi:MAG: hypothetical protein AB7G13_24790 [Lautropia sp.]